MVAIVFAFGYGVLFHFLITAGLDWMDRNKKED